MEPLGQCVALGPHQHWQQLCVIATAPRHTAIRTSTRSPHGFAAPALHTKVFLLESGMGGDGAASPRFGLQGVNAQHCVCCEMGFCRARNHREKSSGRGKGRQEAFSCTHTSGERCCSSLLGCSALPAQGCSSQNWDRAKRGRDPGCNFGYSATIHS